MRLRSTICDSPRTSEQILDLRSWEECILNAFLHSRSHPFQSVHCTLHSHFTLHTPHLTIHTWQFTLHTLHSTLYTQHFTPHTPHFTLYTPHFTLHTLHLTLHIPHFTLHTPQRHLILVALSCVSFTWFAFGFVGFSCFLLIDIPG